jgi:predicted RNase H-like HicB family nuclease
MNYPILFEKIEEGDFPSGHYYAHLPTLGLTTHGLGIEGARAAALDLARLWIGEKRANGEAVPSSSDCLLSTLEIPEDALQSA